MIVPEFSRGNAQAIHTLKNKSPIRMWMVRVRDSSCHETMYAKIEKQYNSFVFVCYDPSIPLASCPSPLSLTLSSNGLRVFPNTKTPRHFPAMPSTIKSTFIWCSNDLKKYSRIIPVLLVCPRCGVNDRGFVMGLEGASLIDRGKNVTNPDLSETNGSLLPTREHACHI